MSLSSTSIRRPVLAIVMSIVIVVFGVIGYTYLGVREFPSVDPPVITVSTNYVGANADVIESQITEPLEESINGIAGIKSLTSVSRDGRSTITVEFDIDVDLEAATNDVRDRVSQALRFLPPDVDIPIVAKADADATPIVFLGIQSNTRNLLQLSEMANNVFKERMQTIPGVSSVQIWGEKKYSMRLWLDPNKLAAFSLSAVDVRNALNRENIELPSGRIEGDNTELSIRTVGRLSTEEEFNDLIIKEDAGGIVRLRDLGYAELGAENERSILKWNGIPMVGVVLIAQAGANNIAIADEFYKRLEILKKTLPADISTVIGFDVTTFIRESITEVEQTIIVAFALVVLIIFLFLRDWRSTIIPVIAIPISLIGAFFVMYIADFTINVLTLLGIVLAIGIVVDDAIIVLENIYVKIENKMEPIEAAKKGASEIFFAVVSTTVALASVFMPVIFLQGLTGRLFREFGIVIAGSVIISAFVALTLTPMLSSRILKHRETHNWFYNITEPFFVKLNAVYKHHLTSFMQHRWLTLPGIGVTLILIWILFANIPSELAPIEDRSRLNVNAVAQEGATFEYMDHYMDQLIQIMKDNITEAEGIFSVTSPGFGASSSVNSGFAGAILVEPDKRKRTQMQIADDITPVVNKLTGARTFVTQQQTIGGRRGGLPVQFVIQAPNFDKLEEYLPKFLDETRNYPIFTVVDANLKFNKPELKLSIDRQKARALGVSTADIAQTIQAAFSGQRFGFFIKDGKQYQVIGQFSRENRDAPIDLKSTYVKNNKGELIQLDNVVFTEEQSAPPQLYRFNRYVSATVSAGLAPGKTLGEGIETMYEIADKVLDESFATSLDGPSKDFQESSSSLLFAFILALGLIYLVLAAQFESFRDPFIILFTVPLALAGALISLWYFDQTMNIFSEIGIIMLIGLVTKNGILIVEFANQRKAAGIEKTEAVISAAISRLRPILMTSLSTILGILPIALALGAGSESRVSMGIAVVGGLIFSTFLTLFIVPAMYSYLSRKTATVSNVTETEILQASVQKS
ncbi:MAG: efflux RND transporter permease subunit [Ignavibacteriota bacterium]|nr:MAG: efflux RND transporter permease subunit [Chlorobiota bacterium]MBE7476102.1 efflux RND transporter permease subunit [Ignavibacteriales bacterium]MBL1124093.1 efflux RND transporter permease subunit [Ignavibacteriota bacterium]MCE7856688.1 efflux RND transporter permease subunit [Ignavibacteria bacterium CHB3]GJQ41047.1 MAG: acriflavin resistance protein [Ignavibacteriaceae bacterium]